MKVAPTDIKILTKMCANSSCHSGFKISHKSNPLDWYPTRKCKVLQRFEYTLIEKRWPMRHKHDDSWYQAWSHKEMNRKCLFVRMRTYFESTITTYSRFLKTFKNRRFCTQYKKCRSSINFVLFWLGTKHLCIKNESLSNPFRSLKNVRIAFYHIVEHICIMMHI